MIPAVAVILSRPRDYPIALRCAERFAAAAVRPHILLDPSEWPCGIPSGTLAAPYAPEGRMVGNACHTAILRALADATPPGAVGIKTDCDVALSPCAIRWLADARETARSFRFGTRLWGGLWAAPKSTLDTIAERSLQIPRCRCPESHLSICALRHHGGLETHSDYAVQVWIPGRLRGPVLTLPRRCPAPRLQTACMMFAAP